MPQMPTNWDQANPPKSLTIVYDPKVLYGTVSAAGSVSSAFDLDGWTQFALQVNPNGGTILGGTVVNIWAGNSLQDTFSPVYGTTGAVASTLQIGSTGIQFLSPISVLTPLRFVKFVLGGTQSAAVNLNLIVK